MKEKKEKKAHGVQLLLRMVVRDPDGNVITDTGRKPARSYVIQFLEFLYALFRGVGDLLVTATDGTEDHIYDADKACQLQFKVDAGVNVATHGVVVGTGDTAEDNTDYALEAQVAEGTGAGQLSHGSSTVSVVAVVGANVDLQVTRTFTNGSGGTITVKEAGIYATCRGFFFHCIIRDVLPAEVDVPDKCSLSVIYTLRTTV